MLRPFQVDLYRVEQAVLDRDVQWEKVQKSRAWRQAGAAPVAAPSASGAVVESGQAKDGGMPNDGKEGKEGEEAKKPSDGQLGVGDTAPQALKASLSYAFLKSTTARTSIADSSLDVPTLRAANPCRDVYIGIDGYMGRVEMVVAMFVVARILLPLVVLNPSDTAIGAPDPTVGEPNLRTLASLVWEMMRDIFPGLPPGSHLLPDEDQMVVHVAGASARRGSKTSSTGPQPLRRRGSLGSMANFVKTSMLAHNVLRFQTQVRNAVKDKDTVQRSIPDAAGRTDEEEGEPGQRRVHNLLGDRLPLSFEEESEDDEEEAKGRRDAILSQYNKKGQKKLVKKMTRALISTARSKDEDSGPASARSETKPLSAKKSKRVMEAETAFERAMREFKRMPKDMTALPFLVRGHLLTFDWLFFIHIGPHFIAARVYFAL